LGVRHAVDRNSQRKCSCGHSLLAKSNLLPHREPALSLTATSTAESRWTQLGHVGFQRERHRGHPFGRDLRRQRSRQWLPAPVLHSFASPKTARLSSYRFTHRSVERFPSSRLPAFQHRLTPPLAGQPTSTLGRVSEQRRNRTVYRLRHSNNRRSSRRTFRRTVCERHLWSRPFLVGRSFDAFQGADLGVHLATKEMPAEESADAIEIGLACGDALVRDSIACVIRHRVTRRERNHISPESRRPSFVYYAAIANN